MVITRHQQLGLVFMGLMSLLGLLYLFQVIQGVGFCWFKELTGLPCFSCGSTRALKAFFHGDVLASLRINPVAPLSFVLCTIFMLGVVSDFVFRSHWLVKFASLERIFKNRWVFGVFVCLVAANWIWNIFKGL